MKPKQNPIAFAQGIIHELAHIRATVDILSHFVIEDMAERRGTDKKLLHDLFKSEVSAKTEKFFAIYSKQAGVALQGGESSH